MKKLFLSFALLLVAGCTTMGKPYSAPPPPPQGKALVYLMRSSVGQGNFWSTHLSVNDTTVVKLYDSGYTWIHLDAGTYKFTAGSALNADYLKFVMPIEAGKEYFIRYNQEPAGYRAYRNVIQALPADQGRELVQKYSYQEPEKVEIPREFRK